jgi:hypothetical protein
MSDSKNKPRILTPHDLAFGIGRVATDEEWEIYFSSIDPNEKGISAEDFLKEAKEHLKKHSKTKVTA